MTRCFRNRRNDDVSHDLWCVAGSPGAAGNLSRPQPGAVCGLHAAPGSDLLLRTAAEYVAPTTTVTTYRPYAILPRRRVTVTTYYTPPVAYGPVYYR